MNINSAKYLSEPWMEKVLSEANRVAFLLNLEITSQDGGWVLSNGIKAIFEMGSLKWSQSDGTKIGGHLELIQFHNNLDKHTASMMLTASAEELLALNFDYECELADNKSGKDAGWVATQDTSNLEGIEPESAMQEDEDVEAWKAREDVNQQRLIQDAEIQIEKSKQETVRNELSLKQTFPALVGQELCVGEGSFPSILPGDPSIVWFVLTVADALAVRTLGYVATVIIIESDIWQASERVKEMLHQAEAIVIVQNHEADDADDDIHYWSDNLVEEISKFITKFEPSLLALPGGFKSLAELAAADKQTLPTQATNASRVEDKYKLSMRTVFDDEQYDPSGEFTDYSPDNVQPESL
jgi:hypothetical protein